MIDPPGDSKPESTKDNATSEVHGPGYGVLILTDKVIHRSTIIPSKLNPGNDLLFIAVRVYVLFGNAFAFY